MLPQIRFSGFESNWEPKALGNLLKFKNGINASKEQYGHGRNFINVLDILNNNFITYDSIINSVNVSPQQEIAYKVEYGDLLFLRSSETRMDVGKCNVYLDKENYALFGGFVIRGKKHGEYDPYFLKLLLNSSKARNQISSMSGGSTRFNVSQDILESVTIEMPGLLEQQKISAFFMKLDQIITSQHQKVENLKLLKKGILQKIFKQEIRFKDDEFKEFTEWKESKLSDVLVERKSYSSKGEDYPHATLSKEGIYLKGERYNRDFLVRTEDKQYKVTHLDDICYNPANLKFGVICRNKFGSAIFSPIYITFEVAKEHDPVFIELFVTRRDFIDGVRKYEEGTVYERMAVKVEDFLNYEIKIPSFQEQRKISKFASTFEMKIEKEAEKLRHLNEMKKGLLHRMFA